MANNVNLSPARVVRAAIAHVAGNGLKFNEIGTLQAMRSPQLKPLIEATKAQRANDENRLSYKKGTGGADDIIPSIKLNYQRQFTPTVKATSRANATNGDTMQAAAETDFDFNLYRDYAVRMNTIDFIALEAEAEKYLEQTKKGVTVDVDDKAFKQLTIAGTLIIDSIEQGLLTDINSDVLNALIAGVGGNLTLGQAAPANEAVPEIALYNADGTPSTKFFEAVNQLKRVHQINGKVLVVGGMKMAKYMDLKQVVSMNNILFDQKGLYNELAVEFYYDPAIDTLYGQDKILVIDPAAACMQTIEEHKWIVKQRQVANSSFGTMPLSIAQYDSGTFDMTFDLKVRANDSGKYPFWIAQPSALYGTFVRPKGFFKTYGGWTTVSGIFGYHLV